MLERKGGEVKGKKRSSTVILTVFRGYGLKVRATIFDIPLSPIYRKPVMQLSCLKTTKTKTTSHSGTGCC